MCRDKSKSEVVTTVTSTINQSQGAPPSRPRQGPPPNRPRQGPPPNRPRQGPPQSRPRQGGPTPGRVEVVHDDHHVPEEVVEIVEEVVEVIDDHHDPYGHEEHIVEVHHDDGYSDYSSDHHVEGEIYVMGDTHGHHYDDYGHEVIEEHHDPHFPHHGDHHGGGMDVVVEGSLDTYHDG
mgnify:CR=1 FL=1